MSSLGDLLLGKTHGKASSPNSDDNVERDKFYSVQGSQKLPADSKTKLLAASARQPAADDVQSNASSTDDYVRELLDPNDRPRNVWHVVEGPKGSPPAKSSEEDHRRLSPHSEDMDVSKSPRSNPTKSRHDQRYISGKESDNQDDIPPPPTPPPPTEGKDATEDDRKCSEQDWNERKSPSHKSGRDSRKHRDRDRDRSKDKSPSSRRHHRHSDRDRKRDDYSDHDRRRDRAHDRSRDRDHHDRRDRSRKSSSRRRHDISDDEDDYSKRHGSRRRHKRSRSRSRSSSRRNRKRSRSDSQSPVTRRNSRTVLLMQLNSRVTSRDLENFFSDVGTVREVRLIMDSKTRRHKGIAYIEFDDTTSAARALALDGQKFFGATLSIQSALTDRNKGDWTSATVSSHTSGHHSSHSGSRGNLPPDSYRVYVGSLHPGITEEMLRSLFEPFGPILRLELMRDRSTNISRGYAFITFANIDDGQYAVQSLDGLELGGKCIRVSKSTEKGNEQSSSSHV